MNDPNAWHTGRSWRGHPLEDECPCPQEPCGLILETKVENCPQHSWKAGKTIRQAHKASDCPAREETP